MYTKCTLAPVDKQVACVRYSMTCRTGCLRRHDKQASAIRTTTILLLFAARVIKDKDYGDELNDGIKERVNITVLKLSRYVSCQGLACFQLHRRLQLMMHYNEGVARIDLVLKREMVFGRTCPPPPPPPGCAKEAGGWGGWGGGVWGWGWV